MESGEPDSPVGRIRVKGVFDLSDSWLASAFRGMGTSKPAVGSVENKFFGFARTINGSCTSSQGKPQFLAFLFPPSSTSRLLRGK